MYDALTLWFQENQRALPWRTTYDPYHIWISEIMLQQTQVETVVPYFQRWVAALPDVPTLARAKEEDVLKLWAGLGYYSRARNIMAASRQISTEYGGVIPNDYDALRQLPGIGQYTAGAILSIAFNKPYPVVDGNVRRVLSRIHGWEDDQPRRLWEAADKLVRKAEPRIINQAVMELGATVCSFRAPRCLICPIQTSCVAFKVGKQDVIPPTKKRPATVRVELFAVVHERRKRYLMRKAKGLWEFPTFNALPRGTFTHTGTCRHTITHHRLEVQVYRGNLKETEELSWQDIRTIPISSLTRKILNASS